MEVDLPALLTVLTRSDLLAYVHNELDSESRDIIDQAIESDPRIRTMLANCSPEDEVKPIRVRRGRKADGDQH